MHVRRVSAGRRRGATEMKDFAFTDKMRIRRAADFERIYADGRAAQDATTRTVVAPNGLGHARLGLSVGRRYGNAVQRNRFKRLVREAFRLNQARMPKGFDIIVIPRGTIKAAGNSSPGKGPTLEELTAALIKVANEAAGKFPPGVQEDGSA